MAENAYAEQSQPEGLDPDTSDYKKLVDQAPAETRIKKLQSDNHWLHSLVISVRKSQVKREQHSNRILQSSQKACDRLKAQLGKRMKTIKNNQNSIKQLSQRLVLAQKVMQKYQKNAKSIVARNQKALQDNKHGWKNGIGNLQKGQLQMLSATKKMVEKYGAHINVLNQKIKKLRSSLSSQKSQYQSQESKIHNQLSQNRRRIKKLTIQNQQADHKIQNLQQRLSKIRGVSEQLSKEAQTSHAQQKTIAVLRSKMDHNQQSVHQLSDRLKNSRQNAQQLKTKTDQTIAENKQTIANLKSTSDEAQNESRRLSQRIQNSQNRFNQFRLHYGKQFASISSVAKARKRVNSRLLNRINSLEAKNDRQARINREKIIDTLSKYEKVSRQLSTKSQAYAELQTKMKQLEHKKQQAESNAQSLQKKLEDLRDRSGQQIAALSHDKSNIQDRIEKIRQQARNSKMISGQVSDLTQLCQVMSQTLKQNHASFTEHSQSLSQVKKEANQKFSNIIKRSKKLGAIYQQNSDINQKMAALGNSYAEALKIIKSNHGAQKDRDRAASIIQSATKDCVQQLHSHAKDLHQLESEITGLRNTQSQTNHELKKHYDDYHQIIADAKQRLAKAQKSIASYRQQALADAKRKQHLATQNEDLTKQMEWIRNNNQKLVGRVRQLSVNLKKETENCRISLSNLKHNRKQSTQKISFLHHKIGGLTRQVKTIRSRNVQNASQARTLAQKSELLMARINYLKTRTKEAVKSQMASAKKSAVLESQLKTLTAQYHSATQRLASQYHLSTQKLSHQYHTSTQKLADQYHVSNQKLRDAQAKTVRQLSDAERRLGEVQENLARHGVQSEQSQKVINRLSARCNSLRHQLDQYKTGQTKLISYYNRRIAHLNRKTRDACRKAANSQHDANGLQSALKAEKREVAELETQRAFAKRLGDQLRSELENSRKDHKSTLQNLDQTQKAQLESIRHQQNHELLKLQEQLKAARRQVSRIRYKANNYDYVNSQVVKLRHKLANAKQNGQRQADQIRIQLTKEKEKLKRILDHQQANQDEIQNLKQKLQQTAKDRDRINSLRQKVYTAQDQIRQDQAKYHQLTIKNAELAKREAAYKKRYNTVRSAIRPMFNS